MAEKGPGRSKPVVPDRLAASARQRLHSRGVASSRGTAVRFPGSLQGRAGVERATGKGGRRPELDCARVCGSQQQRRRRPSRIRRAPEKVEGSTEPTLDPAGDRCHSSGGKRALLASTGIRSDGKGPVGRGAGDAGSGGCSHLQPHQGLLRESRRADRPERSGTLPQNQ